MDKADIAYRDKIFRKDKERPQLKAILKVLDKDIDTRMIIGKFFLTIIGAVAELERENINERVIEGVVIAKVEGKYKGRKKVVLN
ncbi:MAG: recombinase family protein [Cetobacterium sp.]|uniref:recombinase family protein n=1 Tax=Cetobacterium sp. TaxID=2071632 RepID=UPI002FCC509E